MSAPNTVQKPSQHCTSLPGTRQRVAAPCRSVRVGLPVRSGPPGSCRAVFPWPPGVSGGPAHRLLPTACLLDLSPPDHMQTGHRVQPPFLPGTVTVLLGQWEPRVTEPPTYGGAKGRCGMHSLCCTHTGHGRTRTRESPGVSSPEATVSSAHTEGTRPGISVRSQVVNTGDLATGRCRSGGRAGGPEPWVAEPACPSLAPGPSTGSRHIHTGAAHALGAGSSASVSLCTG